MTRYFPNQAIVAAVPNIDYPVIATASDVFTISTPFYMPQPRGKFAAHKMIVSGCHLEKDNRFIKSSPGKPLPIGAKVQAIKDEAVVIRRLQGCQFLQAGSVPQTNGVSP